MKQTVAIVCVALAALAQGLPTAQSAAGPDVKLVLLIAVDQFRYDYLTRFRAGYNSNDVALNDLAPTLATLAGIEIPAGSSGRVLTEALRPLAAAAPRRRP